MTLQSTVTLNTLGKWRLIILKLVNNSCSLTCKQNFRDLNCLLANQLCLINYFLSYLILN
jgi:hypothetical protein